MSLWRAYAFMRVYQCIAGGHLWSTGARVRDEDELGPYTIHVKKCTRCGVAVSSRAYDDPKHGGSVEIERRL